MVYQFIIYIVIKATILFANNNKEKQMKKMLIIVSLLSFTFAGEMGLSAYGGLGLANISYEADTPDGVTHGMKPGLNIGVQYNKLPVLVGAGISMRGSVMSMDGVDDKTTTSMNYLDISVLYPYAVGPGNVFAGLDIGINLSATTTVGDADAVDLKEVDDVINGLDYGLLVGYTYPINETMGVSAGYYLGLADWSGDGGAEEDVSSDKHNGIIINVGYALPF